MARRKTVIVKSNGDGFDETSMALTQNQSGVMLEKIKIISFPETSIKVQDSSDMKGWQREREKLSS